MTNVKETTYLPGGDEFKKRNITQTTRNFVQLQQYNLKSNISIPINKLRFI